MVNRMTIFTLGYTFLRTFVPKASFRQEIHGLVVHYQYSASCFQLQMRRICDQWHSYREHTTYQDSTRNTASEVNEIASSTQKRVIDESIRKKLNLLKCNITKAKMTSLLIFWSWTLTKSTHLKEQNLKLILILAVDNSVIFQLLTAVSSSVI